MNGSTDKAVVELVLTVGDQQYRQKLGEDGALLKKFGAGASAAGGEVKKLGKESAAASAEANTLIGRLTAVRKALDGASSRGSVIGELTAIKAAVASLGGAFAAAKIGSFIYETAKSFESLNAQLLTSEKTQQRAQIAFDRIREFAASTPYELEQVTEAYIKLRNRGLDPSIKALTAYGNIAGGLSKSLDQVIEAVADASAFEFERLRDFGITAKQQGDQVSFTFQGVTTTVAKNATEIERYLQQIGEVNFAGGMERQARTLSGVASNLGDAFAQLAMRIDSGTGFTGAIKRGMSALTEWVNQMAGVPRSLSTIADQIAEVEAKLAALPLTGRATAARGVLDDRLAQLRDEQLRARVLSTDPAEVARAEADLRARQGQLQEQLGSAPDGTAMRGGRRTQSAEQARLNAELQETVGLLAKASAQRQRLAEAAKAEADEQSRVGKDKAAAKAADEREKAAKALAALRKAEEQMLFNEAKATAQLLDSDEKRVEALRELIRLRQTAAAEVIQRTNRTLDLQGYSEEDASRLGQLQTLADKYDADQQALDDYYQGQLDRQAEYQDASKALLLAYQEDEKRINQSRADDAVAIDGTAKQLMLAQAAGFSSDAIELLQTLGGQSKSFQLGLLAFQKGLAIAEIIVQTQVGAAKAVGQAGPLGLSWATLIQAMGAARVAIVAATGVAQAGQISGGRQFGGPVGKATLHPFMEGGDPEVIETANGKVYLGVPGGGRVTPAQPVSPAAMPMSAMAPKVQIINTGPQVRQVAPAQFDGETLKLFVDAAVGAVLNDASTNGPITRTSNARTGNRRLPTVAGRR